jgi:hypothetical protein
MSSRLATAVCASAGIGAALFGASPLAHANQDPGANPPNCSAADLEGVRRNPAYYGSHLCRSKCEIMPWTNRTSIGPSPTV